MAPRTKKPVVNGEAATKTSTKKTVVSKTNGVTKKTATSKAAAPKASATVKTNGVAKKGVDDSNISGEDSAEESAGPASKKTVATKKAAVAKKPAAVKKTAGKNILTNGVGHSDVEDIAEPVTDPGRKRKRSDEPVKKAVPSKRKKTAAELNTAPDKKLNIYVVGDGESGELGLGPKTVDGQRPTNLKVPRRNKLLDAYGGIVQISTGGMHCISLTQDQKILTWGVNDNGALGRDTKWEAPTKDIDADSDSDSDDETELNPKESTPGVVPTEMLGDDIGKFVQVVGSDSASFALTSTGNVYGWGTFRANDGPMGFLAEDALEAVKLNDPSKQNQLQPTPIPYLSKIKSLAAGQNHILALDHSGRVFAWGTGEQSQLGRKITERFRLQSLNPARLGLTKVKQIACGAFHSFAITNDGLVYAWGLNNFGQTGVTDGAGEGDAVIHKPTVVENLREYRIREIQGGEHHSIACTEDGKLLVWGRCDEGQAGFDLTTIPKDHVLLDSREKPRILLIPTVVPGIQDVISVAAAIDNSFAITSEGKAYGWGYSENYRTGLGTDDTVKVPTLIAKGDIKEKKVTFAGCGGQFSVLAGPES
ncbi:regulator of chromosome condensation 1/beta-lactamase-inhibitor protein II [Bisporella sp. PMI_857]|nr:regulator of chromosome condensation 1/beta-lactamase-inhibitor protein II [Bisporella sp. PMI_857]